ncbi:hypothetical protein CA267_012890 [Alteromonas pelagimontana]|uniref:Uncharacterized protein n=1 Tax=Alteromonas pelagimontana TaxID=1858656 RepID=A0A6M4MG32_9ALTE|nr:hypothetical protein [Alteromonas pelagimontana]QJR81600.1 hypothetical protein CA267_012890 [Alteromonas pelagimontana]
MNEWISAIGFGIGLLAFVLGVTSIIMSFMTSEKGMSEKVEYSFFGVAGIVICMVMGYALS